MKRYFQVLVVTVALAIVAVMRPSCRPQTAGVTFVTLASEPKLSSVTNASPVASDELVIPVGKGPGAVILADVNHDGHLDILVANAESETLSVLLGDGKGHFVEAAGSPFACGKS